MKEEVRWLIGIGVILAGLILNFQRVVGNRIDQLDGRVGRLEQALAEHRVETAMEFDRLWDTLNEHKAETTVNFNRLEGVITGHRVEAAREFGEIRSSIDFLLTGDPPGSQ